MILRSTTLLALASCSFELPMISEVRPPAGSAEAALTKPLHEPLHGALEVAAVEAPGVEHEPVSRELPPFELPDLGPRPSDPYEGMRFDLAKARQELYLRRLKGEIVTDDALATLVWYLPPLMESWVGTKWSYSGTTQRPRRGKIACGYYVSTVLQHAGFGVDRVDLARQASEQIIRSLVPDPDIERLYHRSQPKVVDHVLASGEGIYVVGLDTHVGFLVASDDQVRFCHSSRRKVRRRRIGVVCEEARTSPSLKSRYTVLGRLDDPSLLDAWVAGAALPTARKGEASAFSPPETGDGLADLGPETEPPLH